MLWFPNRKKGPSQAAIAAMVSQGPVITTGDNIPDAPALEYRFGAILRDRQQRVAEKRERHPEHQRLTGEAVRLGGTLVERGVWTVERFDAAMAEMRGIG